MSSRLSSSDPRQGWRPVSPAMYSSAYRGERHRAATLPGMPSRWTRLRMTALVLIMAVAGFWAVRLVIWGVTYWRN